MSKEAAFHYAAEFIAVKRGRTQARAYLRTLRNKWLADYDEFYDTTDQSWWEETEHQRSAEIQDALRDRDLCNKQYRSIVSKLDKQFGKGLIWIPSRGTVDVCAPAQNTKEQASVLGEHSR